jgi:hypothetical protein
MRSGMSDMDCKNLEHSLAEMEPTVRDRVTLMLEGIGIQTEFDDPTMAFAARYLLTLAQRSGTRTPTRSRMSSTPGAGWVAWRRSDHRAN